MIQTFIDMANTTDCKSDSIGLNNTSFVMFNVHNRDIQLTGTFLTSQVEKNCIGSGPPSRDSSSLCGLCSCPEKAIPRLPLPHDTTTPPRDSTLDPPSQGGAQNVANKERKQ